ncbi:MAG TPA: hypothetical protein VN281_14540, partial [Verrucomicrobiae bacterium]|nr:hypothetical protein [Verrucomicrobiae bacterium]
MPIVTVLQARNSKFLKYTVNALPWPAVIPELPIPIKNVASARSEPSDSANARPPDQANTNSGSVNSQPGTAAPMNRVQTPPSLVLNPPTASQPAPANTTTPSPATQPPPIQPTQPAQPAQTQPQLAVSNPTGPGPNFDAKPPMPNPPAQAPAPPGPAVIQTPPPIANANAALVPKSPEHPNPGPPPARIVPPVVAAPKPNPPPGTPPPAVANAQKASPAVKPNPIPNPAPARAPDVASKPRTNPPPVQTTLAVQVTGGRSKTLLIAGVSLLCVAIGLLYLTLRRIRGGGASLITRSMGDLRLRK